MSEHELLVYVPRMTKLGWMKATLNGHINLIHNCLPWPEQEIWMKCFEDEEGFIEKWIVTLLTHTYAVRDKTKLTQPWVLHPLCLDSLHAAFKRDWTTFDSVLGIWELSEAKD